MIERLPTPWGLVRLGVAPDHPQLKTVSRAFEKIAARPGFRFFGNVEVGRDVTQDELAGLYDAVVYAVGSQTDRRLGIPGEDLPGSWPATELVAWYNGHPDFQEFDFDLSVERAVVIGNGNVALDVARMLALTDEELAPTDTTDAAIAAIVGSGIREILVLGRRGPVQASWTSAELQELGDLAGADVLVDPAELELDAGERRGARAELEHRSAERRDPARVRRSATSAGKPRAVRLRFRTSPVAILGSERVEAVEVVRNRLDADAARPACAPCRPTSTRSIPCGLVFRSVGYLGTGVPGVPFDERAGTIPNDGGRVLGDGEPVPGLYCAGWIKRGPTGVIGTNKKDATETVDHLLEDARAGLLPRARGPGTLDELLAERGVEVVTYAGWERIDASREGARRAAGPSAREARHLGRAARRGSRRLSASTLGSWPRQPESRALWGSRDGEGDRELPGVRRADPAPGRPLAGSDQGRRCARERRPRPARCGSRRAHRVRGRPGRCRGVRRPVSDRRLPDGVGHELEHERQRGDRRARGRRRAPERPREHGPVLERRLPLGGAPRRACSSSPISCSRRSSSSPPPSSGRRPSSTTSSSPAARISWTRCPVTLGQEFGGYAAQVRQGIARMRDAMPRLGQIPLGGTATGTGLNTHPEFAARVRGYLSADTGLAISAPVDHFEAQAARDGLVEASGALKVVAVSLTKIANDLRLMGSGPRAGLAEIFLPELQKGSSIMPGKVNPVIPEVVTQVAAQVIGNDTAITVAGMGGHFELNVYIPLMARNLLDSIELLASASRLLAEKCVDGIEANRERNEQYAESTLSAATALNPYIGYDKGTEIVKEASASGRSIREVAREAGVDEAILDEALDYRAMAKPHDS